MKILETEDDYKVYPLEGLCGKCGNYRNKLDVDCLCETCIQFGVTRIGTQSIPEDIRIFTRLRAKP
jgi:hypothetical protein